MMDDIVGEGVVNLLFRTKDRKKNITKPEKQTPKKTFAEELKPHAQALELILRDCKVKPSKLKNDIPYFERNTCYPHCFIATLKSSTDLVVQRNGTLTAYVPFDKSRNLAIYILNTYKEQTSNPTKIKIKEKD